MNPTVLGAVVAGLVVVAGVLIWNRFPYRQKLKRFEDRSDLNMDQIYAEFFASKNLPKELACELWNEVSGSLQLPPGKLRPTDRFDQELAAPKGWEYDDDIVEVQWAAERRLKQSGTKADLSRIKTVADYVEFFCNLQTQPRRA